MALDLPDPVSRTEVDRLELRADCSRCVGLCCVAPSFSESADFAFDKPAGVPCRHLGDDLGCTIHDQLRDRGFAGCTVFDCLGAGQKVVQTTFGGARTGPVGDWRDDAYHASQMFVAFQLMRQLHELLWYLAAALGYAGARPRRDRLRSLLDETERLTGSTWEELARLDVDAHRERVNLELRQVSSLVRGGPVASDRDSAPVGGTRSSRPGRAGPRRTASAGEDLHGRDLIGQDLRRRDLRRADLRGTYLLGADLRGLDLALADLLGADLRAADVRGSDLARTLFLTQPQVNAARGDSATRLPDTLTHPPHWAVAT